VLGYYSWGSNDPAIRERHLSLAFVNGAVAAMFVSTDARTFNEPPSDWKVAAGEDATTQYAGSHQSLTGDLIRDGVTGIAGHVAEPYLDATIRPNVLFSAYVQGANLAEAFYLAMPYLSWQTIVIGDPLCAPFRTTTLTSNQIDKGIDSVTENATFFSNWRLKVLTSPAMNPNRVDAEIIKLLIRADARFAKQDLAGLRQLLEEATARDKRLGPATLTLALLYEQGAEYDKAIERYRQVLEIQPDNVVALNNLAYALAVRRKTPKEALPLAEKAYGLAGRNPTVADTLGFIAHLAGDDRRAKGLLAEAIQGAPQIANIRIHAAVVLAALGEKDAAQQELAKALELDPKLAGDDEVQQLRKKLQP
jgi:Tfp pilus assembly protein PilF